MEEIKKLKKLSPSQKKNEERRLFKNKMRGLNFRKSCFFTSMSTKPLQGTVKQSGNISNSVREIIE